MTDMSYEQHDHYMASGMLPQMQCSRALLLDLCVPLCAEIQNFGSTLCSFDNRRKSICSTDESHEAWVRGFSTLKGQSIEGPKEVKLMKGLLLVISAAVLYFVTTSDCKYTI